jgi:hypothetical protein
VALARAVDARVDAGRAEIVVATIAHAAVEVLVGHGLVAVVAVDHPGGARIAEGKRLWAQRKLDVVGGLGQVGEEAYAVVSS